MLKAFIQHTIVLRNTGRAGESSWTIGRGVDKFVQVDCPLPDGRPQRDRKAGKAADFFSPVPTRRDVHG